MRVNLDDIPGTAFAVFPIDSRGSSLRNFHMTAWFRRLLLVSIPEYRGLIAAYTLRAFDGRSN